MKKNKTFTNVACLQVIKTLSTTLTTTTVEKQNFDFS